MPSPARSLVELEKTGLVSGRRGLDLLLKPRSGHYRVMLDLCKFPFFLVGVYEFMTQFIPGIKPRHDGLWPHRPSVSESD